MLGTGHLFSITTFDITLTALVLFLIIRALRLAGRIGPWLLVGVAAGVATEIKLLVVLVLACCLAGLLIIGPRHALRTAGPWLAALVALVLAAPQLVWQTAHGWPMLEVAASIAAGTRPVVDWATTGRARLVPVLGVAAVLTLPNFVFSLPLAPAGSTMYGIATSVNPDGAETVGWPDYMAAVDEVVAEFDSERGDVIILTDNYGEAGALTRERRRAPDADERLPPVYSGHNAFGAWSSAGWGAYGRRGRRLRRGRTRQLVRRLHRTCRGQQSPRGRERGDRRPIRVCTLGDRPWADLWPEIRRLG